MKINAVSHTRKPGGAMIFLTVPRRWYMSLSCVVAPMHSADLSTSYQPCDLRRERSRPKRTWLNVKLGTHLAAQAVRINLEDGQMIFQGHLITLSRSMTTVTAKSTMVDTQTISQIPPGARSVAQWVKDDGDDARGWLETSKTTGWKCLRRRLIWGNLGSHWHGSWPCGDDYFLLSCGNCPSPRTVALERTTCPTVGAARR